MGSCASASLQEIVTPLKTNNTIKHETLKKLDFNTVAQRQPPQYIEPNDGFGTQKSTRNNNYLLTIPNSTMDGPSRSTAADGPTEVNERQENKTPPMPKSELNKPLPQIIVDKYVPIPTHRYGHVITVPAQFEENIVPTIQWQPYRKKQTPHHRMIGASGRNSSSSSSAVANEPFSTAHGHGSSSASAASTPAFAGAERKKNKQFTITISPPPKLIVTDDLLRRMSISNHIVNGGAVNVDIMNKTHILNDLFTHYSDGICVIDSDGKIEYCNQALTLIYMENNLRGRHISYLVPQNYVNFEKCKVGDNGGALTASHLEYQTFTIPGTMLFVSISFGPFQISSADSHYGFLIGFRDITETRLLQQEYHEEYKRNEQLIRNLLPEKIIDRLNNGEEHICDDHSNVTVGFCDIVQFTKFCSEHKSSEVVKLLNTLFTYFDKLAIFHGIMKIETIGDAYMFACGAFGEDKHSYKCLYFMLEALKIAKTHLNLDMRAGIAAGPLSSGIIGTKLPHFSLFGENVCKASRLETAGRHGFVHVSEKVLDNLMPDRSYGNIRIDEFQNMYPNLQIMENGIQKLKGLQPFSSFLISYK